MVRFNVVRWTWAAFIRDPWHLGNSCEEAQRVSRTRQQVCKILFEPDQLKTSNSTTNRRKATADKGSKGSSPTGGEKSFENPKCNSNMSPSRNRKNINYLCLAPCRPRKSWLRDISSCLCSGKDSNRGFCLRQANWEVSPHKGWWIHGGVRLLWQILPWWYCLSGFQVSWGSTYWQGEWLHIVYRLCFFRMMI